MFSRTLRQASKLRTATVPLPLAPGPGIVPPQAAVADRAGAAGAHLTLGSL